MATINVSNASQLSAALSSASGGDTIVLADGNYGDITLGQDFASKVTITSATPLGATFGKVSINGSNITLDGVTTTQPFSVRDAAHIEVKNSDLQSYWNEALFSTDVSFIDNDIKSTLNFEAVDGFAISGNAIGTTPGGVNGDLVRIIGVTKNGVIENNTLSDVAPKKYPDGSVTHADGIQFMGRSDGWPSDIVISGNLIYDDPTTGDSGNLWMQAIAVGGTNIVIENNMIMTGSPNAIIVANAWGGGVEVLNNTVLPWPGGGGGNIRITSTTNDVVVSGNVSNFILNEGGANLSNNFTYSNDPSSPNYWGSLFDLQADGMQWTDYLPADGSPIDFGSGYGALERLMELRGR